MAVTKRRQVSRDINAKIELLRAQANLAESRERVKTERGKVASLRAKMKNGG